MNPLASALFLLAQEEYPEFDAAEAAEAVEQVNLLQYAFQSLGFVYTVLLFGSGFLIFLVGLLVVALARRPAVSAAYLVFVPIPLLIGVFGTFHGFIASMSVVAMSAGSPRPSDVAEGLSMSCFSTLVGILCMLPAFFVVSIGLFMRTLFWKPPRPAS